VGNNLNGVYFDGRSRNGSALYAQGNDWDVDFASLELEKDGSSVLVVCPVVGDTAPCRSAGRRAGGGTHRGAEDVLALVDEAERAHLDGDMAAFEIAADAVVATLAASATEDERRAAFEATTRLFAWAQPAGPLASLAALAGQEGEARPWALRALGVGHAFSDALAEAGAVADTLASGYAGSEHAQFGLRLAVRVAVLEEDEAGALAALDALVSLFPEAEEIPELASLVQAMFPAAGVTGTLNRRLAPTSAGAPAASAAPGSLLGVGAAQPNPASASASVPFELTAEATVEAVLYDALGRRVAVLASGRYGVGRHTVALDGAALPAGVYVVYVTARTGAGNAAVAMQRLTLAR
jgi:hypothetical protein